MLPIKEELNGDEVNILFCSRNKYNQSIIRRAKVSLKNYDNILVTFNNQDPVFLPGELGAFDDNGVSPSCCISNLKGESLLYYIGWKPRSTVRMSVIAGLAIRDVDLTYKRISRAPILSLTDKEPISLLTAPWVIYDKKLSIYRMWYVSGKRWISPDKPEYNVKYAESEDGSSWIQTGLTCIDNHSGFTSIARPSVIEIDDTYHMWYSAKKIPDSEYQIYHAISKDGYKWINLEDSPFRIFQSEDESWDSEMAEYSCPFIHKNKLIILYNGNGYGTSGAGLAYCEVEDLISYSNSLI